MLKGLGALGKYITVINGDPYNTYINTSNNSLMVGNVRFNSLGQTLEVFDGYQWVPLQTNRATVQLSVEAEDILDWAKKKRDEESKLEALAKKNPAMSDLLKQREELNNKIEMVHALIKEEEKIG